MDETPLKAVYVIRGGRRRWWPARPRLNPSRCISCRRRDQELRPVYGGNLPGACPRCWAACRTAFERFKAAWQRHQPAFITAGAGR